MSSRDRTIRVGGSPIREGTALYDTVYYRPLWVTSITGSGVTVEPLEDYDVGPTGHPPTSRDCISVDSEFDLREFESLVRRGRFEISPR